MRILRIPGIIAMLAVLAFAPLIHAKGRPEEIDSTPVSYCELVSQPSTYAGKMVRVRALYIYSFEVQRLESPECCPETEKRVWVELDVDRKSIRALKKAPEGTGLVLGTFVGRFDSTGSYGHARSPFQLTVLTVEKIEHLGRPSATNKPEWLPRCASTQK